MNKRILAAAIASVVTAAISVTSLAVALAADDGSTTANRSEPLAMPENHYRSGEIARAVGDTDRDHLVKIDGIQCEVQDYLTSAGSVSIYADAGDVVATNPSQTAGIVLTGAHQERCHRLFTDALADL